MTDGSKEEVGRWVWGVQLPANLTLGCELTLGNIEL